MAHIAGGPAHGRSWQSEIERLITMGAPGLKHELEGYRDPLRITPRLIIHEFEDAASEVTWRQALSQIGFENGLIDAKGKPCTREAERIIMRTKKAFCRARRRYLQVQNLAARGEIER